MPASSLAFLFELINASVRHLNFLFIDIRFTQSSVITNISIFLTIADNQIDGLNNEVNAVGYPVQNTAQISKLIYRYYNLSVCLWVDTEMLVRDILPDFFLSVSMLIVFKRDVRHSLAIPIMCIGYGTSCSIVVESGNVCEICSQPSTSGDTSIVQKVAPKDMYY